MAAEVLSQGGVQVDVYDAMPSVGRKFLLAGKGGMNITHSEPYADFVRRYGGRAAQVGDMAGGSSTRGGARMDPRPRHRHLRRQLRAACSRPI